MKLNANAAANAIIATERTIIAADAAITPTAATTRPAPNTIAARPAKVIPSATWIKQDATDAPTFSITSAKAAESSLQAATLVMKFERPIPTAVSPSPKPGKHAVIIAMAPANAKAAIPVTRSAVLIPISAITKIPIPRATFGIKSAVTNNIAMAPANKRSPFPRVDHDTFSRRTIAPARTIRPIDIISIAAIPLTLFPANFPIIAIAPAKVNINTPNEIAAGIIPSGLSIDKAINTPLSIAIATVITIRGFIAPFTYLDANITVANAINTIVIAPTAEYNAPVSIIDKAPTAAKSMPNETANAIMGPSLIPDAAKLASNIKPNMAIIVDMAIIPLSI